MSGAPQYHPVRQELIKALREVGEHITEKKDPRTNIVDQQYKRTYALPNAELARLYAQLEKCRENKITAHFSERQNTEEHPHGGIMLDFDIVLRDNPQETTTTYDGQEIPQVLTRRQCTQLTRLVVRQLKKDLVIPAGFIFHAFFIVRPAVDALPNGGYKYGFHMLLPGVQVTRAYKKYLIEEIKDHTTLRKALRDMGAVGSPNAPEDLGTCLDMGSASVPVLFLGSCKAGKEPYPLDAAYEIVQDEDELSTTVLNLRDLANYNLVYELALCAKPPAHMVYGEKRPPLVETRQCEYVDAIKTQVETLFERTANNVLDLTDIQEVEQEIADLSLKDPEVETLKEVLELLDGDYASDYNKWRNVVFALCNTSKEYFPLANWFSQRCPEKWTHGGEEALRELWNDASADGRRKSPEWRPISKRSLYYWANQCSPVRFKQLMRKSYHNVLSDYVYKYGGALAHAMVAHVLHLLLRNRFVTDVAMGAARASYQWYEFVSDDQEMRKGEVWKWRREADPDEMQLYISRDLVDIAKDLMEEIETKRTEAGDPDTGKFYQNIKKEFSKTIRKFYDDGFKGKVINQARYLFRKRGFIKTLDSEPDLLGVGNGVLRLATTSRPHSYLINHYHEWPVSRYTTVHYRKFDPKEYWTSLMLEAFRKLIPEIDMRLWYLMYLATGLFHGIKTPLMLMIVGSGSNGKTFPLRMMEETLGEDHSTKLKIQLLTSDREQANAPNSALMRLKGRGFCYFEESTKREVLNCGRLKEIVNPGKTSGSEKFKEEESFKNSATLVSLSNYPFDIRDMDGGTWRRIRFYNAKVKFTSTPDPNNPFEHKDDKRFIQEFVEDPECQSAFLSILVHFWEVLQNEFDGSITKCPCETLDRETEEFRNSQDMLNRFITERVVISPGTDEHPAQKYTIPMIANHYSDWFSANIEVRRWVASDLMSDLESSALSSYLVQAPNSARYLTGCRILGSKDTLDNLRPGESYFSAVAMQRARGTTLYAKQPDEWWTWRPAGHKQPPAITPEVGGNDMQEDERSLGDRVRREMQRDAEKKEQERKKEENAENFISQLLTEEEGFTLDDLLT